MTYTDVFGSATLPPSEYGYTSFTLTTNATFVWPYNTDGSSYQVAKVMDIACDAGNEITLPDCTEVSTGEDFLIRNVGANVLIVKDAAGVQVASVAVGAASYFYLTDNTTAAGVFGVIGFGVGTSTADASSLVGYGIKAVGASLNQAHPVQPTNTGITLSTDHRAKLVVFTGGVATFALDSAATLGDDYFTMFRNDGTGTATIDPAASELIDGMTSMQVQPGESLMLICTGTKWYSVGYGRSTLYQFTQLTKDVSAGGTITLSATEAANKLITFIGNPSTAVEVVVPAVVAVYYTQNAISTAQTITLKTSAGSGVGINQGTRVIALCDGTNVVSAQSAVANTSVSLTDGSVLVPSLFFATQTNTGLFKSGTQDVGVTVGGSAVAVFGSTGLQTTTIGPNSTQRHTLPTVPSDTVTLNTATQTLTNKTLSVDNNTVSGIAASSFVLSDGSGNINGTAAQKVIPTGVVVGTTDTQTLTNKTLTAPVINSPTGITKADVGLGNVDNTSDATKNSAITTLTNKTISADSNTLTYLPSGTGSILTNIQDKLRSAASVKDFGAIGDGITDDTAAIQAAVNFATTNKAPLRVPTGTYLLSSITITSGLTMYGDGPASTIFKQNTLGAAILYEASASNKSDILIESIGFDVNNKDSGIHITNVSSMTIRDCNFSNNPFWGINIGIDSARANTTTQTCEDILIENCRFNNSTSTYEHIVLFNGKNMVVRDCQFVGAMSGGIGIGLYQNLRHVTVSGCFFRDITKGLYYSVTTNDISITDCEFQGCTIGIQGANESDWGLFGEQWVYGLSLDTCRFYQNDWAAEIGSVRGGSITNCQFERNVSNALVFSYGNRLSTPTIQQSVNILVQGCNFINNNQAGNNYTTHPAVLFNEGGGVFYVTFVACTFEDSQVTKTQYYPIVFSGAFSWSGIRLFGCRLAYYGTGASISLVNSAVISDMRLEECTDLSALPAGVSAKTGGLAIGKSGIGYGTGAGGTVTQATSKSTAVTLNTASGQITLNNAALASGATAGFLLNNNLISAQDVLLLQVGGGAAARGAYSVWSDTSGLSGSVGIFVKNISGVSLSESVVINFSIIKTAIS